MQKVMHKQLKVTHSESHNDTILSCTSFHIEWVQTQKRNRKERTVKISGHHVLKDSVGCEQWEARPTLARNMKQPAVKKTRARFESESVQLLLRLSALTGTKLTP